MTGQGRSAEGKETRTAKTNTHTHEISFLSHSSCLNFNERRKEGGSMVRGIERKQGSGKGGH